MQPKIARKMPRKKGVRNETTQLVALMKKMLVGHATGQAPRRKKNNSSVPAGIVLPVNASKPARRRRRAPRSDVGTSGSIRVRRCELFQTVTVDTKNNPAYGSVTIVPSSSVMTWLNGVSKSFDRIKWHKCRLYWKSAVGTMTDGLITFGVDFDSSATINSRASVTALTPVYDGPVWQTGASINIPQNRLSTRNQYSITSSDKFDQTFGSLAYYCNGSDKKSYGDIWIEYDVTLSGTRE